MSVTLGALTIVTGLAVAMLLMAESRAALGLPMDKGSLEGIRLKFIAWLVICLLSIPLAFYFAKVFLYGAFGLFMVSVGKFTLNEAKQFALFGSDPMPSLRPDAPAQPKATREALITGLISANAEAVAAFGDADNCVVVDWRDGAEEIFDALAPFLPQGYLRVKKRRNSHWSVQMGDRSPRTIKFSKKTSQEEFFVALNEVLAPDFELRQYTPVDGDGYSLFLAPTDWWQAFAEKHPRTLAKYFLSTNRLAAYSRKGFLARLISKP